MSESESCLARKISNWAILSDDDNAHIGQLERDKQSYPRHAEILTAGAEQEALFVLKEGWAYSFVDMRDGRRQIVRVFLPGDIIGFEDMPLGQISASLRAASPVVLCPFERRALQAIFEESPRLAAILFALACRDQGMFIARLRAVSRMDARERLIQMLLDVLNALRLTEPDIGRQFVLPLSQTEIGDFVGLTNVHVSKTLIRLEQEGLIARGEGNRVTILAEEAMERIVDYENRHKKLHADWFPPQR